MLELQDVPSLFSLIVNQVIMILFNAYVPYDSQTPISCTARAFVLAFVHVLKSCYAPPSN